MTSTRKQDLFTTMALIAVAAAILKFLCEGVSIEAVGHKIDFGHVDSMTYATFLAPILGVHGYLKAKKRNDDLKGDNDGKSDKV